MRPRFLLFTASAHACVAADTSSFGPAATNAGTPSARNTVRAESIRFMGRLLPSELASTDREPRDVSTGPGEALHEPLADRVGDVDKDDWESSEWPPWQRERSGSRRRQ